VWARDANWVSAGRAAIPTYARFPTLPTEPCVQ
jgi:hypothetical protein